MKKLLLAASVLFLSACTPTTAPTNPPDVMAPASSSTAATEVTIDWKVWPAETDDQGQPHSSLFLTVGDDDVKIGDYGGVFGDLREVATTEKDVLMHGQYWWAGAGDEFIVKRTATGVDILHRLLQEEVDIGAFTLVKSIPLTAEANITVAPARESYQTL